MVRPVGSTRNKELGITFARLMTVPEQGWSLSRQGRDSIYDVFAFCYPSSVRENKRNGITQMELNKALEETSFHRIRFRKKSKKAGGDASDSEDKCKTLGSYRFGDRRWRNPDIDSEMQVIRKGWDTLSQIARPECNLESWLTMLRAAIASNLEFIKCYEQRGTTEWVAPAMEIERQAAGSDEEASSSAGAPSQPSSLAAGLESLISASEQATASSADAAPKLTAPVLPPVGVGSIATLPFLLQGVSPLGSAPLSLAASFSQQEGGLLPPTSSPYADLSRPLGLLTTLSAFLHHPQLHGSPPISTASAHGSSSPSVHPMAPLGALPGLVELDTQSVVRAQAFPVPVSSPPDNARLVRSLEGGGAASMVAAAVQTAQPSAAEEGLGPSPGETDCASVAVEAAEQNDTAQAGGGSDAEESTGGAKAEPGEGARGSGEGVLAGKGNARQSAAEGGGGEGERDTTAAGAEEAESKTAE